MSEIWVSRLVHLTPITYLCTGTYTMLVYSSGNQTTSRIWNGPVWLCKQVLHMFGYRGHRTPGHALEFCRREKKKERKEEKSLES